MRDHRSQLIKMKIMSKHPSCCDQYVIVEGFFVLNLKHKCGTCMQIPYTVESVYTYLYVRDTGNSEGGAVSIY